jgi:nucleotide-binding universal stress UspA family protein
MKARENRMSDLTNFPPQEILAPVDLSDLTAAALAYARLFHERFGSRITVVHAESFEAPPYFTREQADELLEQARATRTAALEHVGREAESVLGFRPSVRIVEGPAVRAILTAAEQIPADLIVMGSHGRGAVEGFFMGSVTERTVRQARVPVLAAATPPGTTPFRHILCPVDAGAVSRRALRYAAAVAESFGSLLTVLHAKENALTEDVCPQATEELRGRCRLEEVLQPGDAVENILRAAHMGDFDLVVMGVEPKSSLWGELVSSTTERVMRVLRKPLLIVPNPFKEESS